MSKSPVKNITLKLKFESFIAALLLSVIITLETGGVSRYNLWMKTHFLPSIFFNYSKMNATLIFVLMVIIMAIIFGVILLQFIKSLACQNALRFLSQCFTRDGRHSIMASVTQFFSWGRTNLFRSRRSLRNLRRIHPQENFVRIPCVFFFKHSKNILKLC